MKIFKHLLCQWNILVFFNILQSTLNSSLHIFLFYCECVRVQTLWAILLAHDFWRSHLIWLFFSVWLSTCHYVRLLGYSIPVCVLLGTSIPCRDIKFFSKILVPPLVFPLDNNKSKTFFSSSGILLHIIFIAICYLLPPIVSIFLSLVKTDTVSLDFTSIPSPTFSSSIYAQFHFCASLTDMYMSRLKL